jgi:UDP-glucose 4-epimerase
LRETGHDVVALDIVDSELTTDVASITDRAAVRRCLRDVQTVFHVATLHKPHLATHTRQDFVDTNVTGTLNLLEEASNQGVRSFVFTSTTSVFGDALRPAAGGPATWVTEDVVPVAKNIYGATKTAAEDLCAVFHRNADVACIVLRTSRFFAEEDDEKSVREAYLDDNVKVNESLYRRIDIEDVVQAHLLAAERAPVLGFGTYIVSATTPFRREDAAGLSLDAPAVVGRLVPDFAAEYERRGWRMFPTIERIYVNDRAREELGWRPVHDFGSIIERLRSGGDWMSPLARVVGSKGYHPTAFVDGPYPVEPPPRASRR